MFELRIVNRFNIENDPRTEPPKIPAPKRLGKLRFNYRFEVANNARKKATKPLQNGLLEIEFSEAKLRFNYRFKFEN